MANDFAREHWILNSSAAVGDQHLYSPLIFAVKTNIISRLYETTIKNKFLFSQYVDTALAKTFGSFWNESNVCKNESAVFYKQILEMYVYFRNLNRGKSYKKITQAYSFTYYV